MSDRLGLLGLCLVFMLGWAVVLAGVIALTLWMVGL